MEPLKNQNCKNNSKEKEQSRRHDPQTSDNITKLQQPKQLVLAQNQKHDQWNRAEIN